MPNLQYTDIPFYSMKLHAARAQGAATSLRRCERMNTNARINVGMPRGLYLTAGAADAVLGNEL